MPQILAWDRKGVYSVPKPAEYWMKVVRKAEFLCASEPNQEGAVGAG